MPEPITIDIYCRASGFPTEDNINLNEQESACRKYCEEHNLTVGMVYYDTASAYQYRDRWILEQVRLHYQQGHTQGVVIYSLDRLSRSHVHLAILLQEMAKNHTILYVVQERLEETATGKLLLMLLGFMAELEQEKSLDKLLTE